MFHFVLRVIRVYVFHFVLKVIRVSLCVEGYVFHFVLRVTCFTFVEGNTCFTLC